MDKPGIIQEHETVKGFIDNKRLLNRSQNFRMIERKKISALLPKSWKKLFNSGILTPTKMRFFNESNNQRMCNNSNNLVNENKNIEANLNLLKRQPANEFGHMLPHFKESDELFVTVHLLNTFYSFFLCYTC